jgi:hypothetical protein
LLGRLARWHVVLTFPFQDVAQIHTFVTNINGATGNELPYLILILFTNETLRGEIGTLEKVSLSKIEPYNTCHLLIEFRHMTYVGTLIFDDATFCRQLCELLQNHHLGKSIKEIGDLDVGRFL